MVTYRIPPRPAPYDARDESGPPDPARLVCGLACSLGEWQAAELAGFASWFGSGAGPVPLRCDHAELRITSSGGGPADIGRCVAFASVPATADGFPGGLVVLAEIGAAFAPGILASMRDRSEWMAMSVRGQVHTWPGDPPGTPGVLRLEEVSLVSRVGDQADPDALVLGSGPAAASVWSVLTDELAPTGLGG